MIEFLIRAIKNALGFSKTEARGTLLLIFIMIVCIVSARVYVNNLKNPTLVTDDHLEELEAWVAEVESAVVIKTNDYPSQKSSSHLSEKTVPTKPKDATSYLPVESGKKEPRETEPAADNVILDLNRATVEELQRVNGIGPTFSQRIVGFRDRLGGFHTNDQLTEVYGLSEETIAEVQKHFAVLSPPGRIAINSDSAKVLARHPYISYDLAWLIINYRKQNGDILSAEDLLRIQAVDDETFARLKPYLD